MPPPRSLETCHPCRVRKVRCPGGPVPCSHCVRLALACHFQEAGTVPPPPRTRGPGACDWCRSQKSKCSGGTPCKACSKRGTRCEYSPKGNRARPRAQLEQPHAKNQELGRGNEEQRHHLEYAQHRARSADHETPSTGTAEAGSVDMLSPGEGLPNTEQSPWRDPGSPSELGTTSQQIASRAGPDRVPGPDGVLLPLLHEKLHLLVEYFLYIYPIPSFSFLNEDTTTEECLSGTLDEALALAVCAITVQRLSHPKYNNGHASHWVRRAEDLIWADLEQPTVSSTQGLLLATQFRITAGDFKRAFMLFSLAARSASVLRLNYEQTDMPPLELEVRRRLAWCLMLVDAHFSIGLLEYELCPYEMIYVKLPSPEQAFRAESGHHHYSASEDVHSDVPLKNGGKLLSSVVRLATIRRDIMRLSRQITLSTTIGDSRTPAPQLEAMVDDICSALQHNAITPSYSLETLQAFARTRWLVRFITAHLAWHQCFCDVTRLFLPGYEEAAPSTVLDTVPPEYSAEATRQCLSHAWANVELIRSLQDLFDRQPQQANSHSPALSFPRSLDIDIAICGFHAARIILYLSQSPVKPSDSGLDLAEGLAQSKTMARFLRAHFTSSCVGHSLIAGLEEEITRVEAKEQRHDPGARLSTSSSSHSSLSSATTSSPLSPVNVNRATRDYRRLGVHSVVRLARFDTPKHSHRRHHLAAPSTGMAGSVSGVDDAGIRVSRGYPGL